MGSVVCSRGMAVFIAMVAPTMRTRPAAALELTGNKSFLQEILPYYSFCEGFLEGGGGGNATGSSSSSLCAKTLQIFFDTSIMKFFFLNQNQLVPSVLQLSRAIPHRLLLTFLCHSLFCRCDFTVECKARQILGQIFSFFVAEKFAF